MSRPEPTLPNPNVPISGKKSWFLETLPLLLMIVIAIGWLCWVAYTVLSVYP